MKNFSKKLLLTALFILFCANNVYCETNSSPTIQNQNAYNSIQTSYMPEGNFYNTFSAIKKQEQDLIKFFEKSNSIQNNSELFAIYMNNLEKARKYFADNYKDYKSLSAQGLNTEIKIDEPQNYVKIIKPEINVLSVDYKIMIGLTINYDYIIKTYCPYLTEDWKEYFNLSKSLDRDLVAAHDGKSKVRVYTKWAKNLKVFTQKYPNFYLNDKLNQKILEYEKFVNLYNKVSIQNNDYTKKIKISK